MSAAVVPVFARRGDAFREMYHTDLVRIVSSLHLSVPLSSSLSLSLSLSLFPLFPTWPVHWVEVLFPSATIFRPLTPEAPATPSGFPRAAALSRRGHSNQRLRNTLVQSAVFQPRRNASWPRQSTRDTKNAIVPWCRARPHATSAPLATLNSATQDRDLTYRLSPGALRGRPFPGFHETRPS